MAWETARRLESNGLRRGVWEFGGQNVLRKPARVTDRSHLSFWYGTQNDDTDYCKTGADLAAIQEEGSPAAPMLRAVNYVADAIAEEFPAVAIDTVRNQR